MKVAFLTNIISPYRRPMFQALANSPGWDLSVVVNATTEFDRKWSGVCEGVEVIQPRSLSFRRQRHSRGPVACSQVVEFHVPVGLWAALSRLMPDCVITHELGPRSLVAAQWARWHRRPLIVWSYQAIASLTKDGWMRRAVRNAILKQASAVVGMGRQARQVLEAYGVASTKIIDAPNATDVEQINARLEQAAFDGTAAKLRHTLGGQDGRRVCLVAGRIEPVKNIDGMLRLWSRLPQNVRRAWRLVFLGDGSQDPLVRSCDDPSVLHVPGVRMDQMAEYYAASDLHWFASLADVWGLVVNESMLAGVPTLCSRLAGCSDDMIADGHNGMLFDPCDDESALRSLRDALQRRDLQVMGDAARVDGNTYTVERLADGFREAVARAMDATNCATAGAA